jgi:integrase
MDNTALLEKYANNLAVSKNAAYYMSYARDFLNNSEDLSRDSIERYIKRLQRKNRAPGTVNLVFRIIRRLYAVNGIEWEYRKGESPAIGQRDEYRPELSVEVIKLMVDAATGGKLDPADSAFVALSTTYGPRREEMANIAGEDVDLENGSLYISTLKHGRERYHLIPHEIHKYLASYDFDDQIHPSTLSRRFKDILIVSGAGVLKNEHIGWHSIRRALWTGLIRSGVNVMDARKFLRWKSSGQDSSDMDMPMKYFGNVVVGLNGKATKLDEAKGDEEIFAKHPFLPFWRV